MKGKQAIDRLVTDVYVCGSEKRYGRSVNDDRLAVEDETEKSKE